MKFKFKVSFLICTDSLAKAIFAHGFVFAKIFDYKIRLCTLCAALRGFNIPKIYFTSIMFTKVVSAPSQVYSKPCHIARSFYEIGWTTTIEIRLYRKGTFILADIHGMDHFCMKLAPPPYNKPMSCVSKIWFGNV
jgi:hypothetical protein